MADAPRRTIADRTGTSFLTGTAHREEIPKTGIEFLLEDAGKIKRGEANQETKLQAERRS
jgi:hypothetical protein